MLDASATRTAGDPDDEPPRELPADDRRAAPLQYRDPERYRVLGEHGRGGLGHVSRAQDKELGRRVAIKELNKRGDVGELRFLREAMITARLEHPNIVPIHEAGRWPDGTPFYVMKLVAGRPLKELIEGRPSIDQRLGLLHHVIAVADAVAYAHGQRIIHRDLKPGNVIAGDFGETIVIDWGLAKDLGAAEEIPFDDGPYRTGAADDLTAAGHIIGTPLYMAPEQARGEAVDERADVFAIGAMLWELCSMQRVPPETAGERERMLRRAGIDQDLITIILKALAPRREERYRHAGELAADLKAFTSGARIAARQYSVPAVVAHWIRRHRAIAATAAAFVVVAVTGAVLYVRDVAAERDRATAQERLTADAKDELVLQNAELLMRTDPTAVVTALAGYRGRDSVHRARLLAEARGRGVADAQFTPHSDEILFLAEDATGAVFSLGKDRLIRVTAHGVSTTIASDVAATRAHAYARDRRVLAYATAPTGIALLDLARRTSTRLDTGSRPQVLAITADGSRVAARDLDGTLSVWDVAGTKVVYRAPVPDASKLKFADASTLVVREREALRRIALAGPTVHRVDLTDKLRSFDASGSLVVTGDHEGTITLWSDTLTPIARAATAGKPIQQLRLIAPDLVVYTCTDETGGVVRHDVKRATLELVRTLPVGGAFLGAVPETLERGLVVGGADKAVSVYDLATRLRRVYRGQPSTISFVAGPTEGSRHILVGDVDGTVRVWPVPAADARELVHAPNALFGVAFSADGRTLVAHGADGLVRKLHPQARGATELAGHRGQLRRAAYAPDGGSFLTVGTDQTVRVWDPVSDRALRVMTEHATGVGEAEYLDRGTIVSVGDDGRLLRWSTTGDDRAVVLAHRRPLVALEVLAWNGHIVVHDDNGLVLDVAPDGTARPIVQHVGRTITRLRASRDGHLLAVGRADGELSVYRTDRYDLVRELNVGAAAREIAFDPQGRDLVIVSDAGTFTAVALAHDRAIPWTALTAKGRDVAYTPDGSQLALMCADGGTWLYQIDRDEWTYVLDHGIGILSGTFSPDGRLLATTDRSGVAIVRTIDGEP